MALSAAGSLVKIAMSVCNYHNSHFDASARTPTIRAAVSPKAQIFDRYWTLSEVRRSDSGSTSAVIDQNAGVRENRPRADTRAWMMSP